MALALGPRVSLALVMICAALSDASPAPAAAPEPRGAAAAQVLVAVPDWSAGPLTPSTPTYQTSVNPKYRVDGRPGASNISAKVFANMAALGADHVRHVPWFPYPHLAVAELQEPGTRGGRCQTHWNWTLIDPITQALMKAVGDHPVVLNFATTPDWMWARGSHPYPPDPNRQDMGYNAGTVLRDSSLQEVVGYFHRLASHYTKRGFVDECGIAHASQFEYRFAWWEVLNEMEHGLTPAEYTAIYDAVVSDLRALLPGTKFLGLAMGDHNRFEYYRHFLDRRHHNPPDVPIDGISYHQYVWAPGAMPLPRLAALFFAQMDAFVQEVAEVEGIKHSFETDAWKVQTFINEIGCGSADRKAALQDGWFTLCAATYAYLLAKAAPLRVERFGMSQVIGFTGDTLCRGCEDEWPVTSMVDWVTGDGNARYWVLRMLLDELPRGLKRVPATNVRCEPGAPRAAHAQAFVTVPDGRRKVLVVSKHPATLRIRVSGATGGFVSVVDGTTGDPFGCAEDPQTNKTCYVRRRRIAADTIVVGAFGTAVVIMPQDVR